MDNKQLSSVVFVDLSKAFDSVQHETLLQQFRDLGTSPAVYTWFKSYVSDRLQYVRIGTVSSEVAPLKYGIPQGSVLSPFLFNIYTNSLSSTPNSCHLESYVDDLKSFLSFSVSTMDRSITAIEEDLQGVFVSAQQIYMLFTGCEVRMQKRQKYLKHVTLSRKIKQYCQQRRSIENTGNKFNSIH